MQSFQATGHQGTRHQQTSATGHQGTSSQQPRVSIVPERFQANVFSAFDPSQMQYTVRHGGVRLRDLPTFAGNPEEWPMFLSSFEYTTEEYVYSDVDNLDRLQKALKGKALESVRCLLMHPSNVPNVISTLKMLYGRPEIIVHSLVNKVRAMPAPKQDRLDTLIDFGIAVQNLCATITATGLDEYMFNVALLYELTERLPSSLKLNWGCHQMNLGRVTLSSFNDWLNHLVQAASLVTVSSVHVPESPYTRTASNATANRQHRHVNAHLTAAPARHTASSSSRATPRCPVCQQQCANVESCPDFLAMDIDARWRAVREKHLCRKYLE